MDQGDTLDDYLAFHGHMRPLGAQALGEFCP